MSHSNPSLTPMIPLMLFLLKLMMILEIYQDTRSIGVMKATRMTKKSNDNGWNVLRTYMPLLKNGWTSNPRVTDPWKILDNKTSNEYHRHGIMETMFPAINIHEETPLEHEKEDNINEHGSYFMNTSSNPCSYEKSLELIGLSNIATHEIINPLILLVHKEFERVVVDAYVQPIIMQH